MDVKDIPIKELTPAEYNPRYISDDAFDQLAKSLQDFDAVEPIVINTHKGRENTIIGGHQRIKAAEALGWDTFPCVEVDLPLKRERELNVKLNKTTGEFDFDKLANFFDADELTEWGFSDEELFGDGIFDEPEAEEDDYEVPDEIETDIVLGDLIEIGEHRLLCGDSTDSDSVAKLMDGEKADMVFTDPDFSMNKDDLVECYLNEKILNPSVSFWICGDKQAVILASSDVERFSHFFIHDFKCATLVSNTQPMQRHNLICKFGNKKMRNLKDGFTTILSIATERTGAHHKITPMSKRIELPAKFIEHYADDNGIIVDFFLHSGSTMVASHQLKRKCYGMDLDPKYCQVIVDRIIKLDPQLEIKVNGKPCTQEVA